LAVCLINICNRRNRGRFFTLSRIGLLYVKQVIVPKERDFNDTIIPVIIGDSLLKNVPVNDERRLLTFADLPPQIGSLFVGKPKGAGKFRQRQEQGINTLITIFNT